ncbi:alpha/beta hydrolase [Alkalibacterium kapii]|uniref:BD-FAE-like domain-containing protein n=1 Tax=Alkalibacterium kapii TaxID=426704 RepID=A0A511ASN7_9LACT|nr:alpha/beta hydrolase [Alkalibacterium kapii]GEK91215.1 hypothetical protein AKA01nite_08370 [Alkalibacterium kapii]
MAHSLKSLFVLNIISIVASLVYFFVPGPSIYANVYGLILILTLTSNILAATFIKQKKKWRFSYLLLSSFGLLIVMGLNTVTSLDPANHSSQSILSIAIMVLLLIIGARLTSKSFSSQNKTDNIEQALKTYRKTRIALLLLLSFLMLVGGLLALIMLTNIPVSLIEAGLSPYSLFYSLIFLSISGMSLNLINVKKHSIITYSLGAFGVVLYILFALPFLSIPSMLNEAEENYTEAFGNEWKSFDDNITEFRDVPVSIPAFFFGSPSDDYSLEEDVLFYEGTEGIDDGLKLRFDAYTPQEKAEELPGEGSVLIRIHGGGWSTGDKGAFNFSQINKYFASQGYIVFDVQYGLEKRGQSALFLSGPDEVYGTFSIDDMVRHLSIFTTYLAENKEDYGADIDSVFISGGSAGGHLASALALAQASGDYTDLIDPRISVQGLIPYYPANDLSHHRDISGTDELVDPKQLVDSNSPPVLLFQGDRDGFVDPQIAKEFKQAYLEEDNEAFAILWMPYGAHASDIYFPGFYNQTFIYYMERFMYQFK